ncbi:MAG: toprim domain-containing protein [Planctomycetota bacterium]
MLKNEDERIRALEHLDKQFVYEFDEMNARAGAYLSQRPYMTPGVMRKWGVGVLPSKSKSMLRGRIVYCLRNEKSEKIGWAGRDLAFEEKQHKWENSDRKKSAPEKTKFPPGFTRGSFLYGAEVERLEREGVREQIQETGLIVCEGFNDVIALDSKGVVAVAICSNRISEGQIEKLVRWSNELANGRITLFLDNDEQGVEGTKQMISKLVEHVHVRTVWQPNSSGSKFRNKQPEEIDEQSLIQLLNCSISSEQA